MSQSDTPRTDAREQEQIDSKSGVRGLPISFCREIERELTATQRRLRFLVESGAVVTTDIEGEKYAVSIDGIFVNKTVLFPTPEAAIDDAIAWVGEEGK